MSSLDSALVDYVRAAACSDRYAAYLRNTLLELVAMNTAPGADLAETASRERAFFNWIEREVRDLVGSGMTVERPGIDPVIATDAAYTLPGYAADASGVTPLVEKVYAERGNLIALVPGAGAASESAAILHAHVDVVPPWFPPRSAGERVFGRGSCDNKAQVAVVLAQLKLMRELADKLGRRPARGFVIQLAIDEEIGGNGSLSLAMDGRFSRLPALILDASDLVPYCAHRGALYYRCKLSVGGNRNVTAVEMFPFVVQELEAENKRIREETDYPMFTADHVQMNQGILGPYGRHPGSVCDHVAIEIVAWFKANPERVGMKMIEFMDEALADYIRVYGDKRRETDPATGKPKIERHFALQVNPTPETQNFRLDVYGKSGHMAAVADCDNAITKASYLLGALLRIAPSFPGVEAYGRFVDGQGDDRQLVLEGGQGFTPSHKMADIQTRLAAAAERGVQHYCRIRSLAYEPDMLEMAFDRLHNDAYADSPNIAPMQALKTAFEALGEHWPEPVAWKTSCDARIYHGRNHPVAIFGAGKLEASHSDDEYVDIPEVQRALAICTLATWALIR